MAIRFKSVGIRISILVGLSALAVAAQDYMPPDRPPPGDWQVQGEYSGEITGGGKLGAWVIGQGGDKYNVVFLPGGLLTIPNDSTNSGGWDKTTKISGSGSAASITTTNGYKASITGTGENRTMTGTTNDNKAFTLKRVVRHSPTLGLKPKDNWNAEYWFHEGSTQDLTLWKANPATPQLKYGPYLYRGITCNKPHQTIFLHIEARSPYCPTCRDQDRGNSGIYLRGMHEMQVLDSFGLTGANNELGAIYRIKAPLVNAALPPLTWQTYDCYYTPGSAPNSATFTVYLNGVLVQDKTMVTGITEAGFSGNSLYLQDHGHDVVFNNIWAVQGATETTLPWETVMGPIVPIKAEEQSLLHAPKNRGAAGIFARPGTSTVVDMLGRDLGVLDAAKLLHLQGSASAGKDD